MPTQKSIPERYPVIEHMEARLRAEGSSWAPPAGVDPPSRVENAVWTIVVGVVGGVSVLGLVGIVVQLAG